MDARAVWPAALLACVAGCAGPPTVAPPPAPRTIATFDPLAELTPDLRELAKEVEAARGLAFRRPIRVVFVDDAELESHVAEGKLEPTPDAVDPGALWAFGLLKRRPPPSWLASLFTLGSKKATGLLGFYVSASRTTFIRREHEHDVAVVAHELAHALVDDHQQVSLAVPYDDQQLARRALSEGDATITAALVKARRAGSSATATLENASEWDHSRRDFAGPADEALASTIPLFRERTEMPYRAGATFAARVVLARGMRGLDRVWNDPPRGTFEIFHPDTYALGLPLPDLGAPPLPTGCRVISEGVMGELRTRAVLRGVHSRAVALGGASGLLADRYRVLEGCGPEASFAWQTAWKDEASAERFGRLIGASLGCKLPGCLSGSHRVLVKGTGVAVTRNVSDDRAVESLVTAIHPAEGGATRRLDGVPLEPLPAERRLVAGSSGRACEIGASGVRLVPPPGLSLLSGHEVGCELSSETLDVSFSTKVINGAHDDAFAKDVRATLGSTLAASHEHVALREQYRVTPVGTGLGFVYELTARVHFEVVTLAICGGKRVLAMYLRSTSEEGRAMLDAVLASLRPASVGSPAGCADPAE